MSTWTSFGEFKSRMQRQMAVDAEVLAPLDEVSTRVMKVAAGRKLCHEGDMGVPVFSVEEGWLIGLRYLGHGRRFIHRIYQKGDIIGLENLTWARAVGSVEAVTDCVLHQCAKSEYSGVVSRHALLATVMLGVSTNDHLVAVDTSRANGKLNAVDRIAHLLLQIEARQALNEGRDDGSFEVPLVQEQIADAAALSVVQTNRSLRQLTSGGVLKARGNAYRMMQREAIAERTGFFNRFAVTHPDWYRASA